MAEQLTLLDTQGWWTCPTCQQLVDPLDIYCCDVDAIQYDQAEWHRQKYPAKYIDEVRDSYEAHVMGLPNTQRGRLIRGRAIPKPQGDTE